MNRLLFVLVFTAYLLLPALHQHVTPNAYEGGRSRDRRAQAERNNSSLARIMGEFRTSISDLMFIKTERYLDSGVAYMPHAEAEVLSMASEERQLRPGQEEVAESEAGAAPHHHEGHADVPTIIPTRERDFRSFIGDLERAVKPYRDPSAPHEHTDGRELLPWYRMMTISDPYNIRAYMLGGWWLKGINVQEGIKFVEEGIDNNPGSFQLYNMLGELYRQAEQYDKATEAFTRGATLAIEQRPPEGPTDENQWTDYMEEDALATIRFAVLLERNYGEREEALRLARRLREKVPDAVLDRLIQDLETDQ